MTTIHTHESLERRMKDLGEEISTEACIIGKRVKRWARWAGHMVGMKENCRQPRRGNSEDAENEEDHS